MKKTLYALTCTILITIACGTSNIATAPAFDPNMMQTVIASTALAAQSQTQAASVTSTITVVPTIAAISTTENQGYLIKEIPIFNSFSETYLKFAKEDMSLLSNNPDLFLDQTWRNQVNGTLEKLLSLANEMESIEPVPQEYIIFDGYHDQIAVELREMVFNYQLWLNGDDSAGDKGLENINKIGILLELLNNEEKRLSNP